MFAVLLSLGALSLGCKKKQQGELRAPDGAVSFERRYDVAFDDTYTDTPIEMAGRAPNDVRDQRLFAARLGHADLVMEVEVEQVWGRGRHRGQPDQYLDVQIGKVLLGTLPKKVDETQLLRLANEDDIPASLEGKTLLFFGRWAPGERPSFHHHLMPTDPELLELIDAMVEHAEEAGVDLDDGSGRRGRRARQRDRKKAEREKKKAKN